MTPVAIEPVNVHDELQMIELGYRNPLKPRDLSVWTKTPTEKKILKKTKRLYKNYEFSSSWAYSKAPIPVYGKIIIQLDKKASKYFKINNGAFTLSISCGQSDINSILGRYIVSDRGETFSLVNKYKWNGTWYSSEELPFFSW